MKTKHPPFNAKRIYRWADLPDLTGAALYRVTTDGQEPLEIIASKHKRQVLEGLMRWPIFAASYCRLSDQVLPLRREGVDIECEMYSNDLETGRKRFGIYVLKSSIERVQNEQVAA